MMSYNGPACSYMNTDIGHHIYLHYRPLNLPFFMVFLLLRADGLSVGQMHNESRVVLLSFRYTAARMEAGIVENACHHHSLPFFLLDSFAAVC